MRLFVVLFSFCILLLACEDSGNEATRGLSAVTGKNSYTVGEEIAISISNGTALLLWLQTCCNDNLMYYVDRLESGIWSQYKTNGIPCLTACPSILIYVGSSRPYQSNIGSEIDERGIYRFRFLFGDDWLNNKELASNSFEIK